jgi:antitoxin component YwqK of YwqJK toxin-antitoxin module
MKITQTILLTSILAIGTLLFPAIVPAQTPVNGKYEARKANGLLIEKGYYTNSHKDKRWYYYNEKGIIARKEKWEKGELQWQIFYNERGRITRTIDKNGKEKVRPACGC